MTQKAWLHNNLGVSIADLEIFADKINLMDMDGKVYTYIRATKTATGSTEAIKGEWHGIGVNKC